MWSLVREFAVSFTPLRSRFDASFESVLDDSTMLALVAVDQSLVVGYLLANRHQTFFANAPVVWVEEIMVDESARGRGVGRALMRAAETWATEFESAYVALATRRAGGFYAALGYDESAALFRKAVIDRRYSQADPESGCNGGPADAR